MSRRLGLNSRVTETQRRTTRCPHCGRLVEAVDLRAVTGVYYMSIRLKAFHDRRFSFCPACRKTFSEEA